MAARSNLSGLTLAVPLPVASGGSGQITAQLALNAFAGGVTNNLVLAGNGTNITLRALAVADLPTGTGSTQVPTGGVITAAGPQGDASHTQVLTFNAAGQLTTVTNTTIAIAESQVTSLVSDLALKSPLASPTFTGTVTTAAAVNMYATAPSTQTADYNLATIANATAITNNAALLQINALSIAPTMSYGPTAMGAFGNYVGVGSGPIHQGVAGTAGEMTGSFTDFSAGSTFKTLDTNAQTVTAARAFRGVATLTVFSGGSLTVTTMQQFVGAAVTVPAGATVTTLNQVDLAGVITNTGTVTTRRAINITASTVGAGTLTTEVGIDIAALTGATPIGIRNKSSTQLGSSAQTVFGTDGTFTTFAGFTDAVNIAVGTSTGTIIGTATTQKLGFFNATPVAQQANSVDLGTVLSNMGFRASGGNPPLNIGTGALTAGTTSLGAVTATSVAATGVCTGTNTWDANALVATNDATTTGQTLVDITGLTAAYVSGTYEFEAVLKINTSTDTNGCNYGCGFTANFSNLEAVIHGSTSTTVFLSQRLNSSATAPTTSYLTGSNTQNGIAVIKGIFAVTGAGTFSVMHLKTSSGGTSTVKKGSILKIKKTA